MYFAGFLSEASPKLWVVSKTRQTMVRFSNSREVPQVCCHSLTGHVSCKRQHWLSIVGPRVQKKRWTPSMVVHEGCPSRCCLIGIWRSQLKPTHIQDRQKNIYKRLCIQWIRASKWGRIIQFRLCVCSFLLQQISHLQHLFCDRSQLGHLPVPVTRLPISLLMQAPEQWQTSFTDARRLSSDLNKHIFNPVLAVTNPQETSFTSSHSLRHSPLHHLHTFSPLSPPPFTPYVVSSLRPSLIRFLLPFTLLTL